MKVKINPCDEALAVCEKNNLACLLFSHQNSSIDFTINIDDTFLGDTVEEKYNNSVHLAALIRKISDKITQELIKESNESADRVKADIAEVYYDLCKNTEI
jgi:hypothetical protein